MAREAPRVANCRIIGVPEDTALHADRAGTVAVAGFLDQCPVDIRGIETARPDIFQGGHFSVFDVLVATCARHSIPVDWYFDEGLQCHVVDAIAGQPDWWYAVSYHPATRGEEPAVRMDTVPYRDWMTIKAYPVGRERLDELRSALRAEAERRDANDGRVVVPEVTIRTDELDLAFGDVEVRPHGLRLDIFRPDVLTAADVMLSIAETEGLEMELRWTGHTPRSLVQGHYFTRFGAQQAEGYAGFLYEAGEKELKAADQRTFGSNYLHIMPDIRLIHCPEYVSWHWRDLTPR